MHRTTTYIISTLFALFSVLQVVAGNTDGDSTQSNIRFVKMEATPSSKVVHFKWDVDAESNGDRFVIEKSLDGEKWKQITEVKSIKNHDSRHTYMVSEINLAEEQEEFFRIKRVDESGKETTLDVVNVEHKVLSSLKMIPNSKARKNQFHISYYSLIESRGWIRVLNTDGELVYERQMSIKDGYNRITLDARRFDVGNYIVVLRDRYGNRLTQYFTR